MPAVTGYRVDERVFRCRDVGHILARHGVSRRCRPCGPARRLAGVPHPAARGRRTRAHRLAASAVWRIAAGSGRLDRLPRLSRGRFSTSRPAVPDCLADPGLVGATGRGDGRRGDRRALHPQHPQRCAGGGAAVRRHVVHAVHRDERVERPGAARLRPARCAGRDGGRRHAVHHRFLAGGRLLAGGRHLASRCRARRRRPVDRRRVRRRRPRRGGLCLIGILVAVFRMERAVGELQAAWRSVRSWSCSSARPS